MSRESRAWVNWGFAAPALLLMALVNLLPVGQCLWWSRDFHKLLQDEQLWSALWNTVVFTGITVSLELILGLGMALLLMESFPGRGMVRAAVLIPWALPTAVMAMGWRWIYNPDYGVFGDVLYRLGLTTSSHIAWLASPMTAMLACILADVWKTTPFMAILLMSGLALIPNDLYEAAVMDGAGAVARFRWITVPLLMPTILLAVLLRAICAFGIFDLIWVLTGGGPGGRTRMMALYLYDTVFRYQELGYGCAITLFMAACLMVMALALALVNRRYAQSWPET